MNLAGASSSLNEFWQNTTHLQPRHTVHFRKNTRDFDAYGSLRVRVTRTRDQIRDRSRIAPELNLLTPSPASFSNLDFALREAEAPRRASAPRPVPKKFSRRLTSR